MTVAVITQKPVHWFAPQMAPSWKSEQYFSDCHKLFLQKEKIGPNFSTSLSNDWKKGLKVY